MPVLAARRRLPDNQRFLRESVMLEADMRWDPSKNCIPNVKIIGKNSINRRQYSAQAKRGAIGLYEDCNVNIDHPTVPNTNRTVVSRFGWLANVATGGPDEDVFGNLYFNPKHQLAESIIWWAQNRPQSMGLSHNAVGQGHEENGIFIVEKIVAVRSVDLVGDPATTTGFFESKQCAVAPDAKMRVLYESVFAQIGRPVSVEPVSLYELFEDMEMDEPPAAAAAVPPPATGTPAPAEPAMGDASYHGKIGEMVCSIVKSTTLSKKEKRQKLLQATHLLDDDEAAMEAMQAWATALRTGTDPRKELLPLVESLVTAMSKGTPPAPVAAPAATPTPAPVAAPPAKTTREVAEEIKTRLLEEQKKIDAELAEVKRAGAKDKKAVTARKLMEDAKLPKELQSEHFLEVLTEARDETHMKSLIEDRIVTVGLRRTAPTAPPGSKTAPDTAKIAADFKAIMAKGY